MARPFRLLLPQIFLALAVLVGLPGGEAPRAGDGTHTLQASHPKAASRLGGALRSLPHEQTDPGLAQFVAADDTPFAANALPLVTRWRWPALATRVPEPAAPLRTHARCAFPPRAPPLSA